MHGLEMPPMAKMVPLLIVAAIIAALAFWHGATGSSASRAALSLFPVLLAMGSWRTDLLRKP
ncbi:hypothetical protein [Novosphingobium aerophilum]|uniref:hypothetical protein n=1 Tax=Novosphingobium aerophilum TaxID=2839843 RepID=UPI001639CBA7|nr:hypothetical protein [Novosphingobium aerophilum]